MLLPLLRGTAEAHAGVGGGAGGGRLYRAAGAGAAGLVEDSVSLGARHRDGLGRYGADLAICIYGGVEDAE